MAHYTVSGTHQDNDIIMLSKRILPTAQASSRLAAKPLLPPITAGPGGAGGPTPPLSCGHASACRRFFIIPISGDLRRLSL